MLTWLIVAYDDDSRRVVVGSEDGGDSGRGDDGVKGIVHQPNKFRYMLNFVFIRGVISFILVTGV